MYNVADMNKKFPRKDYMLLISDIQYGFEMTGSPYDEEPFRFKQLEKMVKGSKEMTTMSLWRIVIFHNMDQGYSIAQV